MDYSWNEKGPELTTRQCCQATLMHPITKEKVWFNKAHLIHISALEYNITEYLVNELEEKHIPHNRKAYQKEEIFFSGNRRHHDS